MPTEIVTKNSTIAAVPATATMNTSGYTDDQVWRPLPRTAAR